MKKVKEKPEKARPEETGKKKYGLYLDIELVGELDDVLKGVNRSRNNAVEEAIKYFIEYVRKNEAGHHGGESVSMERKRRASG